jgi:hypothetical protein
MALGIQSGLRERRGTSLSDLSSMALQYGHEHRQTPDFGFVFSGDPQR